jgi:3-phenylpropionate/cinnamic acid dioxygenase small subunit
MTSRVAELMGAVPTQIEEAELSQAFATGVAESMISSGSTGYDRKLWEQWIGLFTDDGIYWMPPEPSYTTWDGTPAIFAEDKNLMRVRMGRVLHPDAWSQRPLWGTNHVVSNVLIEKASPSGEVIVRSRFHMMELRRDDVRHFAGSYRHHLEKGPGGYRIKLQRVDMTNAQAAYDYVLQVWV